MELYMIIVSAPSGGGKNSFIRKIIQDLPQLEYVTTYTTREPRRGEKEGNPYYFISEEKFHEFNEKDFFVEAAKVHGNWYGTPKNTVQKACKEGKIPITDLDIQGAKKVKKRFPKSQSIFLLPPSLDELRHRILKRDAGTTANLSLRLDHAKQEIKEASYFDFQLTNRDFATSYEAFKKKVKEIIDHFHSKG